jgi:hypothetical protein
MINRELIWVIFEVKDLQFWRADFVIFLYFLLKVEDSRDFCFGIDCE